MEQVWIDTLFALLRSALCGEALTASERETYSPELLPHLAEIAAAHDVTHLLALGLKHNGLLDERSALAREIFTAVYRCEELRFELERICDALESARIDHLPLKGAVLRAYYPEPWMRTSCDIDILVRHGDLASAIACLVETLHYTASGRGSHDVALVSPRGSHMELHFDLMEEGAAKGAAPVLNAVWAHAVPCAGRSHRYAMEDGFFYFYHIAHMAKHFENGGCGIRPLIDLQILRRAAFDATAGQSLLDACALSQFALRMETLSDVWFAGGTHTALTRRMEAYILCGGSYGSIEHRVAALKKDGSRGRYLLSRAIVPYERLVRYYPILEKHRYLMPVMQVRRWFMLLHPDVAEMARGELTANHSVAREERRAVQQLLRDVGL